MAMHSFFIGIIYQGSMQSRPMPSARIMWMRVPSNMNCFDKVATLAETIIPLQLMCIPPSVAHRPIVAAEMAK